MIGPQLEYPVEGIGKRSARSNLTIYKFYVTNKHVRDFRLFPFVFAESVESPKIDSLKLVD